MKTQTDSLKWWNTLSRSQKDEYSFEYFGTDSSYLIDDEISAVYYDTQRYYIEFVNSSFLCLFPATKKELDKGFETLNEALDYMLVENNIKEVTIKN